MKDRNKRVERIESNLASRMCRVPSSVFAPLGNSVMGTAGTPSAASFARTPDYSSGTFSFGSSTEREYYLQDANELSNSGSYSFHRDRLVVSSNMAHLVGESSSTPITKTLDFNPSLNLSFDFSGSEFGDDDSFRRLEREEELGFMRALGFEFDEIARRVREEPL